MTTPLSPPPTPYLVVGDRNGLSFVNRKSRSFDDSWPSISVSGGGVQDLEWSHDRELLFVARQGGDSGLAVLNNITKSVDTGWPVIPGNCVAVSGEVSNNPALGVAYTESPFYSILDIESKEEVSGTWPSIPDTPNDMDHTSWFTHIAHRGGNGLSMFRRWHTGSHQDHSFHTLPSDTPWGYPVGTSVAWAQSIPPFSTVFDQHVLFVGHYGGNHLTVLWVHPSNDFDFEELSGWPSISGVVRDLALNIDNTKLAVAHDGPGGLTIIDTASKQIESGWPQLTSGRGTSVTWSGDGHLAFGYMNPTGNLPETGSFVRIIDAHSKTVDSDWPTFVEEPNVVNFGSVFIPGPPKRGHITNYVESFDYHWGSDIAASYVGDPEAISNGNPIVASDVPKEVWEAWSVGPMGNVRANNPLKVGNSPDNQVWVHHISGWSEDNLSAVLWHDASDQSLRWAVVKSTINTELRPVEDPSFRNLTLVSTGKHAPSHGVVRFKGDMAWARDRFRFFFAYEGGPEPKTNNCYIGLFKYNPSTQILETEALELVVSPSTEGAKNFAMNTHNSHSGGMPLTHRLGLVHEGDGVVISKLFIGFENQWDHDENNPILGFLGENTHPEVGNFVPTLAYGGWRTLMVWGVKDDSKHLARFRMGTEDFYETVDIGSNDFQNYEMIITSEFAISRGHSNSTYVYQQDNGVITFSADHTQSSGSGALSLDLDEHTDIPYTGTLVGASHWGMTEMGTTPGGWSLAVYVRDGNLYGVNASRPHGYTWFNEPNGWWSSGSVRGYVDGEENLLLEDVVNAKVHRGTAQNAMLVWVNSDHEIFVTTVENQSVANHRKTRLVWPDMGFVWGVDEEANFLGLISSSDWWGRMVFVSGDQRHLMFKGQVFLEDVDGWHYGTFTLKGSHGDEGFYWGPGVAAWGGSDDHVYFGYDLIEIDNNGGDIRFHDGAIWIAGVPGFVQWEDVAAELGIPPSMRGYANLAKMTEAGEILEWHQLYNEEIHGANYTDGIDAFAIADDGTLYWSDGWEPIIYKYTGEGSSSVFFEDPTSQVPGSIDILPDGDIIYSGSPRWASEYVRRINQSGNLVASYFLEMSYRDSYWWVSDYKGVRVKPNSDNRVYIFTSWDWIPIVAEFDLDEKIIIRAGVMPNMLWGAVEEGFGLFHLPTVDIARWDMETREIVASRNFDQWRDWRRIALAPDGNVYIHMETEATTDQEIEFNPRVAPPEGWSQSGHIIDVVTRANPDNLEEHELVYAWFWEEDNYNLRGAEDIRHSFYFGSQFPEIEPEILDE